MASTRHNAIAIISGSIVGLAAAASIFGLATLYFDGPHAAWRLSMRHIIIAGLALLIGLLAGWHSWRSSLQYRALSLALKAVALPRWCYGVAWASAGILGLLGGYLAAVTVLGLPAMMHMPMGPYVPWLVFVICGALFGVQTYRDTLAHYSKKYKPS